MSTETLGFVGLGNMGLPMAMNLARSGYRVRAYNRTPGKAGPLQEIGATVARDPADAAAPGGVVFTMVADDDALLEVALAHDALAGRLGHGGVHVSMSTVSPEAAARVARHHASLGVSYVAAPVFGRPEAAEARKLAICVSGPAAAKARVRPFLEALGQRVFDMGEEPGAANVAKLVGNFWIMSAIETMAEGFALAEKNGLDPARVADLLGSTLFACPIYQNYGRMLLAGAFEPAGFRLQLGLKDVNLMLKTGGASGVPLPVASLLHDRMLAGVARGRGNMDWTAVSLDVRESSGL